MEMDYKNPWNNQQLTGRSNNREPDTFLIERSLLHQEMGLGIEIPPSLGLGIA